MSQNRKRRHRSKNGTLAERLPAEDLSTMTAWARHWLDTEKSDRLSYSTRVGYCAAIDLWIAPAFGSKLLTDVTTDDISDLYIAIREAGRSRSLWQQVRTVLKQALASAVDSGHLTNKRGRSSSTTLASATVEKVPSAGGCTSCVRLRRERP